MSHLDVEIAAQPEVLGRLLRGQKRRVLRLADWIAGRRVRGFFVVARGSSDNAGLYGKYLFGARNRRVVALATPSLFTLYERPPDLADQLVVAISQSGGSTDLGRVVEEARRQGAATLVITNRPKSALARLAEQVLPLGAGIERSVAATKTYTAELMALAMLSVAMRGTARDWAALERVPEAVAAALQGTAGLAEAAERYRYMDRLAVIGRGFNYATAFELSLKLKELAYVTAEPSSSADFRHGPIAVVGDGFPVLLIAPRGRTLADLRQLVVELRARRAELIVISDDGQMLAEARTGLRLPMRVPEWLSPMVAIAPGQLFARHLAAARDCPLDRPRGLSKVTITR